MSRWKKIAISLMFLIVIALDSAQIFTSSLGAAESPAIVTAGGVIPWIFELKKQQYDKDGNFVGCWGTGSDCLVIRLTGGSESVTLSMAGVHTQEY